jgi:DNA-binding transcriptional regulator YiaG
MTSDQPKTSKDAVLKKVKHDVHTIDAQVGRKIRALRGERNFSQAALAERVGVTFQQIQKYESGANRVGASKLYEIARALDVDASVFFVDMPPRSLRGGVPGAVVGSPLTENEDGVRLMHAFSRLPKILRRVMLKLIAAIATELERPAEPNEDEQDA